ncbi:MAG TPA: surface-adhesin E family protein [Thiobacillus sp.]
MSPALANNQWEVLSESPAETISIEFSTLERLADRVNFRVRHTLKGGPLDVDSQRPIREILDRRMVDCRGRRVATLSRAVFSDYDALIHYQAERPIKAEWQPLAKDDPLLKRVCE